MRVLVTNDDGIDGPGLHALAHALVASGHEVVVIAPSGERSGSGASMLATPGADGIEVHERTLPGLPGVVAHAVDGPPALCVMIARSPALGAPVDLVAAGVNPGANTGRSTPHSGTVGAALTAANFGVPAVAVSQSVAEAGTPQRFAVAAELAATVVDWLAVRADRRLVVNLNVPNRPRHQLAGARWASLAPFGVERVTFERGADGRVRAGFLGGPVELPPDCDTAILATGCVTVTPVLGLRAADPVGVEADLDRVLAGAVA